MSDSRRDPVTLAMLAAALPPDLGAGAADDPIVVGLSDDTIVVDLTHDSRQVGPGWLFVCVPGATTDGHAYAPDAVAAGASALVVERRLPDLDHVPQLVVDDARRAVGHLAAALHGNPSRDLVTVGITGTNGKTTTAHLLGAALEACGLPTSVSGTLTGPRTTPEAPDLQRRLAQLRDEGCRAVVMEVSSHALALHRVDGMRFDAAVFTNLGLDHLDLHGSVEEYERAKARLFDPGLTDLGVVNRDDAAGRRLIDQAMVPIRSYGSTDIDEVQVAAAWHGYTWRGHAVHVPIGGAVNVWNSLAALTCCDVLELDVAAAIAGLGAAPSVPGRFETVASAAEHGVDVVVDYAHTPDALATLLASARRLSPDGRVFVVFGCGGGRDHEKRPLMGAEAAAGADVVVVTSDNPRDEDPIAIIDQVLAGIATRYRDRVVVEPDRRAAIAVALERSRPGDLVVIAGKGHETTQTVGATTLPFDDRVVARELLEGCT